MAGNLPAHWSAPRLRSVVHAVTRGLNPNVPLDPSGVEWLGGMPEHWEVTRLKQLFREMNGEVLDEGSARIGWESDRHP